MIIIILSIIAVASVAVALILSGCIYVSPELEYSHSFTTGQNDIGIELELKRKSNSLKKLEEKIDRLEKILRNPK